MVPAHNTALVEGEPVTKHKALLPPTIEAVLEHGELLAVMCHAIKTAFFFVGIDITITPFVVLVSFLVKMKTGIDIFEGILWHEFH